MKIKEIQDKMDHKFLPYRKLDGFFNYSIFARRREQLLIIDQLKVFVKK